MAAGFGVSNAITHHLINGAEKQQLGLPECDTVFAGTVTVTAGGTNVTGDSIFQNNLGVVGNLNVGGTVTASKLEATQGASFLGGGILIGNPDHNTLRA